MIIGTAGHIDHGKTTLVRAITGTNTDRLEEEKKRGITIELGYAYVPTEHGDIIGFVDVPGHERLVHTMVAGATGIDFALLVIAADDGVMPQTLEHVAVLELLGIQHGAVVISKADRVHSERIEQLLHSLPHTLAHTFLHDAPVFVVDALSEEKPGLAALQSHLAKFAAQHNRQHRSNSYFRLAVDRVFSLAGHGTVVTGTVYGGHYNLDDSTRTLQLLPAKKPVRVRSIHAQNRKSQEAKAGQRCALNLGGIDVHEIERGDWIADLNCFEPTQRMDVSLRLLPHAAYALSTWSPWHVHIGSAHYLAHAVPLSSTVLQAGEEGFVQLVFTQPVCALPGDRFILRNAQAKETVGGGVVLDTHAPDRKRRSAPRLHWLQTVADSLRTGNWDALVKLAPHGLAEFELIRLLGTQALDAVVPSHTVWLTSARNTHTRYLIHHDQLALLSDQVLTQLQHYHTQHPDEPGIGQQRLHRICAPTMPNVVWECLLSHLRTTERITSNGAWLHLPEHRSSLPENEQRLAEQLLARIHTGHFDPPWTRDLATEFELPDTQVRELLRRLVRLGELYQVVPDLFYHQQCVAELATVVAQLDTESHESSAIQFRRATQLGRKRAIQVLEFFDRIGYTRRVRNHRLLRGEAWPKPDTL